MRNVWELPPEEVFKELGTTPEGLSKDEAERRLKEIKKLRGRRGAIMRKLKRLRQLKDSGAIAEDAYLTLSSELEEDLIQVNERLKELLKG
ncbi:MAG: cation-transporting P-type ATPase [Thermoproteota archaeon]